MANPTTNYGWPMPTSTDLVTDLPADFDAFGQPVDTTLKALNPETTLGDIAYRSATANTNTRLGIGSTGNILTVAGGVPTWAAPASSGGMTVLASGTLSGASLSLTSIAGTYRDLVLRIKNPSSVSGGGSGPLFSVNGIVSYGQVYVETGGATSTTGATGSEVTVPLTIVSALNTYAYFEFVCNEYASTTSRKSGSLVGNKASNNGMFLDWSGDGGTTAINAITVTTGGAGNWDAGTYVLYGVQ
jgi:hypothetical protein